MRERTVLKPMEVEERLDALRALNGIGKDLESKLVKEMVSQAYENNKMGDITSLTINPLYLHIPEWQRDCEIERAREIGEYYDSDEWDQPKVFYYKGKLYVVDGMHRIYGAAIANLPKVTVRLLSENSTLEKAIKIFLNQTESKKKMSLKDKWNAALEAGITEYVVLKKVCDANKVCVGSTKFNESKHVGTFTSTKDGLAMALSNPEMLDDIFKLIGKLQWNGDIFTIGKAYGARAFRVIRKLYSYYGNCKKEMESVLVECCGGSEFWKNNLDSRTQAQMFDLLSNIINKNLVITNITSMPAQNGKGLVSVGA